MSFYQDARFAATVALKVWKYLPTWRVAWEDANTRPLIMAGAKGAWDFLQELHADTATVSPANPQPSVEAVDAISELQKQVHVGPSPEGNGNPQV